MRIFEVVAGVLLVLSTWISVLATLVVPRGLRSRHATVVRIIVRWPFQFIADHCRSYETKDRVLAWSAPLSILATLLSWLVLFVAGFGLLVAGFGDLPVTQGFKEAGSSVFTLGVVWSAGGRLTLLDFSAAATGPVIVGLLVGYLPALYGAYARRETEVTLLVARGGSPAWGPEILSRHWQIAGLIDTVPELFRNWERWSAEVAESHTSYPVLLDFRSPRAGRNWLVALLAIMDAAALELALNPSRPDGQIRLAIRSGFTCVREIASSERIPYDEDPDPDSDIGLTYAEFSQGIDLLRYSNYPMERTAQEAWPHFRGWRVNYESTVYELAYRIDAVPAPWSGPRRRPGQRMTVRSPQDRQPTVPKVQAQAPTAADPAATLMAAEAAAEAAKSAKAVKAGVSGAATQPAKPVLSEQECLPVPIHRSDTGLIVSDFGGLYPAPYGAKGSGAGNGGNGSSGTPA